jgi:hypothetical protein
MTATLYLWLLAMVLLCAGAMLIARGWWLDKAAGNHKRARCRRCWYELGATPPAADGAVTCPECGLVARTARELHRVKRNRWVVAAGAVLIAGGVYLSGRPLMQYGNWLYMLPRSVSARLWQWAGAEQYGRDLRRRVSMGTATEAEIDSLKGQNRRVVLKGAKSSTGIIYNELDDAFKALATEGADPEVEAAAGVLQADRMPMFARSAITYLNAKDVPMARRIEMANAALAKAGPGAAPTEYFQMLLQSKDPAAIAALVQAAASKASYASWARSDLIQTGAAGLRAVVDAFYAAKTPQERSSLLKLFGELFPHHRDPSFMPFLFEVAADRQLGAQAAQLLNEIDGSQLTDEQLKTLLLSGESAKVNFAIAAVEFRGAQLPEGCGEALLNMHDAGRRVMSVNLLSRFTGADRLLWLPRMEKGDLESRREACQVVRHILPPPPRAVEILRTIERNPRESEEMRVEARDALRQLGAWKERERE